MATGLSLQFVQSPKPPSSYEVEILQPLHKAQAAKALADAQAAQAAAKARDAAIAARAASEALAASPAPTAPIVTPITNSESWYKTWIYNEESGNNPTRWNTSGCLGLGQACPASKLLAVCPTMDYTCEDNWFTNYMLSRYGSWYKAYVFHIANNWW